MRKTTYFIFLLFFIVNSACYNLTIDTRKESFAPSHRFTNHWYRSWLLGFIEGKNQVKDPDKLCPSGVGRVNMQLSAEDVLVGLIPFLGYVVTFRTNSVYCLPETEKS